MVNINGNLDSLLKLPMKIMTALSIGCGLILFLPNNTIEKMYMLKFRDDFGFIIGVVFIISATIVICNFVVLIIKKIAYTINKNKNDMANIKNLTSDEKEIINKFYNKDLSKFISSSVHLPANNKNSPILHNLVERNILEDKSYIERLESYNVDGSAYNLTSSAIKKLNKTRNKKRLV